MILTDDNVKAMKESASRYPYVKSAILPCLTIAYRQEGYLYDDLYHEIANVIGVSPNEVASAAKAKSREIFDSSLCKYLLWFDGCGILSWLFIKEVRNQTR